MAIVTSGRRTFSPQVSFYKRNTKILWSII